MVRAGLADTQSVTVLLFASYAERLGASTVRLEIPRDATVRDVVDALRAFPGGHSIPERPLVAVNRAYADPETVVGPEDEVAVIPPVAGG